MSGLKDFFKRVAALLFWILVVLGTFDVVRAFENLLLGGGVETKLLASGVSFPIVAVLIHRLFTGRLAPWR